MFLNHNSDRWFCITVPLSRKVPQKTHHGEEIVDERSEPGQKQIHEGLTRSVSLPDSLHRNDKDVAGSPQIMVINSMRKSSCDCGLMALVC